MPWRQVQSRLPAESAGLQEEFAKLVGQSLGEWYAYRTAVGRSLFDSRYFRGFANGWWARADERQPWLPLILGACFFLFIGPWSILV